ncbi:heavy metal-associated isoprenylated plant protein 43-like [Actinidia eriantha]|uniref:heavy metal-associated isoprenylated plant protein 43-like n=1 Tax=Actinidia eriantha TaxID=165200 RepID=UPI002583CAA1|nr:heavy metal-associated isoprenylated plant protein 43-like [Actinidia eriantha]
MKKTVLRVSINCQKCKKQVLKAVTKLEGINSVAVDGEKWTLTVIGVVDPVCVVKQIRKIGKTAEILTVGPPKPKSPEREKIKPLPHCCKDCQLVAVLPYEYGICSIL